MNHTGYDRVNQTITILKEFIERLRNSKAIWFQVAMERLQYEYILNFALLQGRRRFVLRRIIIG